MKKFLTSVATVLLLTACTSSYDDSAIKTRLDALETRVTALEGNVLALQSAIGDGVFVAKVQEYADPDTGKTIGVTVTYTNGDVKYFEISPKADYTAPVLGVIKSGSGALVWAIDGIAIMIDGKEVPVYQTPVFTIDGDGNLLVSIDGSDPVVVGKVKNEGATLVDGIFTDIKVEQDKVVLTLSDNSVVNIPFADAFKLNIETTEYVFSTLDPIEIPYTVGAKTSGTVVGVAGYNPKQFTVTVEADKIVVTPVTMKSSAILLAYADSKVGLTSLVNITVEAEGVELIDTPYSSSVDYMAEGEDAVVEANVVSNVEFDVKPQAEWISLVSVKAQAYVITLALANNETGAVREGTVNLTKKGTDDIIQTITIAQDKIIPGAKDLGKKETANSYIVTAAGNYKFAPVKGNSEESVGTVAKAELYWETWNNAEEVTVNSVIASVGFEDGFITFSTPETLKPGNAVIAAKDANDVILWSWHIWIPASEITTSTYGGIYSYPMMDRNLGALVVATADAEAQVESYGLFYQWGRKDPFPGPKATSGSSFANTTGPAPSQLEGDGSTDACKISLEKSIQNPLLMGRSNSGDWIDVTDNNLWVDEAKTMYDPCPPGYRVPARISADPIHSSDYSAVTGWSENKDYHIFTMGDPAAVFPFSGYLDDYDPAGGIAKNGLRTIFWTAHKNSDAAGYCMNIRESTSGGNAHKLSSAGKSRAGSVRCVVIAAE